MKSGGLLRWAYAYILKYYFSTDKKRMAIELRVTEKTLQTAMQDESSAESMLLFEQLMCYFMKHNISIDAVLAHYKDDAQDSE